MSKQTHVFLSKEESGNLIGYLTEEKKWIELGSFTDRDSAIEFAKSLNGFIALRPSNVYIQKPAKNPPTHGLWADIQIEFELAPVEIVGKFVVK